MKLSDSVKQVCNMVCERRGTVILIFNPDLQYLLDWTFHYVTEKGTYRRSLAYHWIVLAIIESVPDNYLISPTTLYRSNHTSIFHETRMRDKALGQAKT